MKRIILKFIINQISLLFNIKVRSDVSMTGEISLKGLVLPVGGIKEKCLAAYSAGIKTYNIFNLLCYKK